MTLSICYADRFGFHNENRPCDGLHHARQIVQAMLVAGYRDLTAELVEDGEVVAYYEHGWTS